MHTGGILYDRQHLEEVVSVAKYLFYFQITEDLGNPVIWQEWLHRYIYSTCFENTHQCRHHLYGAVDDHTHKLLGLQALSAQLVSDLIGHLIERSIGDGIGTIGNGDLVWSSLYLLLK